MGIEITKIFQPGRIGTMKIKNRLVCPPMMRNFATAEGFVTPRSLYHYEALAKGGVGLIILEATCVESPRGKSFHYGFVLDNDRFIPGFRELARVIQRHGARVAIQLYHGGYSTRMSTTHMQPVGPSALAHAGFGPSRELALAEIQGIVSKFGQAAERAQNAGLDGVEIHAAHGYLLAQFLSPAMNKRRDEYGGSLPNRARFLLEVVAAVRKSTGKDFPVWCRINGQELGIENGLSIDEARTVAVMLEKSGADAVHVSGFGSGSYISYHSGLMYDPSGNLLNLAEAVKKAVRIPVIAVGKIDLDLAEKTLQEGRADFTAIGRGLLVAPNLPVQAAQGQFEDIRPCLRCRMCSDGAAAERRGIRCQVNAALGNERECELKPAAVKKRVLIVGGGPAGLEAARVAAQRGHEVMLYEKDVRLGGKMILAAIPPHKAILQDFTDYLTTQVRKLGVRVELGHEVSPSQVDTLRPDTLILATGSLPILPKIPGIENGNIINAEDALRGTIHVGQRVAVIGGGLVGCEVADHLSEMGREVTIIEMLPHIPLGLTVSMMGRLLHRLSMKGVTIRTSARCGKITERGLAYTDGEGKEQILQAETIVMAVGWQPNRELGEAIGGRVPEAYLIGDCVEPRHIGDAVADGFHIGRIL